MTDIKLYNGCWVKTQEGSIVGPLRGGEYRLDSGKSVDVFGMDECAYWRFDGEGTPDDNGCSSPSSVVAVYPSLAAAAAANPEM